MLRPDTCCSLSCHFWTLPAVHAALDTLHVPGAAFHAALDTLHAPVLVAAPQVDHRREGLVTVVG